MCHLNNSQVVILPLSGQAPRQIAVIAAEACECLHADRTPGTWYAARQMSIVVQHQHCEVWEGTLHSAPCICNGTPSTLEPAALHTHHMSCRCTHTLQEEQKCCDLVLASFRYDVVHSFCSALIVQLHIRSAMQRRRSI